MGLQDTPWPGLQQEGQKAQFPATRGKQALPEKRREKEHPALFAREWLSLFCELQKPVQILELLEDLTFDKPPQGERRAYIQTIKGEISRSILNAFKVGLEKDSENIYGHIQELRSACLLWVVYFYFYQQDKYFKNLSCLLAPSFRAHGMLPTFSRGIFKELGFMFVIKLTYNHSIDPSLLIMAVKCRFLQHRGKHYIIPNFENYN